MRLVAAAGSCHQLHPGAFKACPACPAGQGEVEGMAWLGAQNSAPSNLHSQMCVAAPAGPTFFSSRLQIFWPALGARHTKRGQALLWQGPGTAAPRSSEGCGVAVTHFRSRLVGGLWACIQCLKIGHSWRSFYGPVPTSQLRQQSANWHLAPRLVPAVPARPEQCHAGIYRRYSGPKLDRWGVCIVLVIGKRFPVVLGGAFSLGVRQAPGGGGLLYCSSSRCGVMPRILARFCSWTCVECSSSESSSHGPLAVGCVRLAHLLVPWP